MIELIQNSFLYFFFVSVIISMFKLKEKAVMSYKEIQTLAEDQHTRKLLHRLDQRS